MAHTPGPWGVNKYGAIGAGRNFVETIIVDAAGWAHDWDEASRAYAAGDKSLIAGAPDLLAAAKALCPSDAAIEYASEEWKRLHAAIKRAEGGA